MNFKKGITLIELVSVIALITILSSICIPCYSGIYYRSQDIFLDIASNELLSDLRLIQQKAEAEDSIYHIYFNNMDNSYMIYSYKDMSSCVYKSKSLPHGIKYDNIRSTYQNNKLSFNSKGKPLPYPCTISLKNESGRYKRITVTVGTDYISLKDS